VARAELFARESGRGRAGEGVADELDVRDAARGVPLALEGEDGEQEVYVAPHLTDAVRAPGPKLRADVVDDAQAATAERACEREVEVGPVNEHDGVGAPFERGALERAVGGPEARQGARDFRKPGDGEVFIAHDRLDAGLAHARAGRAEELELRAGRPLAQRADERGGVRVARLLARHDQQAEALVPLLGHPPDDSNRKDEGGRMKDEVTAVGIPFILRPSAFILPEWRIGRGDVRLGARFRTVL
jgi:hypothetical protein